MSQKIIDIITDVLLLVLVFTAGVVLMYQVMIHRTTVTPIDILNPATPVIGAALRAEAEPAHEMAEPDSEPMTVSEMIAAEANNAGVDPELALAVAKLETAHFTSDAYVSGNNVGGLSDNEVPRSYVTLEEGVTAFIKCLKEYFDAGLTTPEEIGRYYCPVNSSWAEVVNELM